MLKELSTSKIDAYLPCSQRGYYAYEDGGTGIVPMVEAKELRLGSIVHAGLAGYYLTFDIAAALIAMGEEYDKQAQEIEADMSQVWDEDRAAWAEMHLLASGMLTHYYEVYWEEEPDVLAVELPFRVGIRKPGGKRATAYFTGVIDLVEEDNGVFLWDHKTAAVFDASWEALNHLNRQFRRYAWAYQELHGVEVKGFKVNGLRKKLPVVPAELKNGQLSQRKDIDTTYKAYMGEIRNRGLNPTDYTEILEILEAKGNTFFKRDTIYFNQAEIEEAGRELYSLSRMIQVNGPVKVSTPLCTRLKPCPYKTLCVEDTPEARMLYKPKERR